MKTAKEIAESVTKILGEREGSHGPKVANMQRIADLWAAYKEVDISPRDVCNMMVLMKIARQQVGDPKHMDHYQDMIGYAAIAGECAVAEEEKKTAEGEGSSVSFVGNGTSSVFFIPFRFNPSGEDLEIEGEWPSGYGRYPYLMEHGHFKMKDDYAIELRYPLTKGHTLHIRRK